MLWVFIMHVTSTLPTNRRFQRNMGLTILVLVTASALAVSFWKHAQREARRQADQAAILQEAKSKTLSPAWSLFDHVSLYQRNGFVEHYGTDFQERRHRPLFLDTSILKITDDRAWLIWWPDHSPIAPDVSHLEVTFAESIPRQGKLTVGFLLRNGSVSLFDCQLGSHLSVPAGAQPAFVPEEFLAAIAKAPAPSEMVRDEKRLLAPLPVGLKETLAQYGDRAVQAWFICIAGARDTDVVFDHISLVHPIPAPGASDTVTLTGTIRDATSAAPLAIDLVLETGQESRQLVRAGSTFTFAEVPSGVPACLRVEVDKQDFHATVGRWFLPSERSSELVIDLSPHFQNPDKKHPDPKKRLTRMNDQAQAIYEEYAKHYRKVWNGLEDYPQEFEGPSFANNIGHLDRDRFFDNPDNCYRIVHLGSSHAVACQVRPVERYNILMEAELGRRLGRPVEVISLGRNNGDLGANFPRVRDIAIKFNPDVILFENGSFLMMQLHPELLRRRTGNDPDHTHLDRFYYAPDGTLTFRPYCPDWPIYAGKIDTSELTPGIPFEETLRVPFANMHPFGRESYQYLADIMRYYQAAFPRMQFVLHTGLDQAQAHGKNYRTVQVASAASVPVGAAVFMENIEQLCRQHGFICIQPALPQGFNETPQTYLTFINDGHFSPRGHQWLAKELSAGLLHSLKLDKSVTKNP
jgi:hypothetical protein